MMHTTNYLTPNQVRHMAVGLTPKNNPPPELSDNFSITFKVRDGEVFFEIYDSKTGIVSFEYAHEEAKRQRYEEAGVPPEKLTSP